MKKIFLILCMFSCCAFASKERGFYSDRERGFYYYETEEEKKKRLEAEKAKKEAAKKTKEDKKTESVPAFSVSHIRKSLPKLRDAAIDNPDDEQALLRYTVLKRAMNDKATRFADSYRDIYLKYPALSETKLMPIQAGALMMKRESASKNLDKVLSKIAKKASIFYFYKDSCIYCKKFGPLLKKLIDNTNFSVLPISLDGLPPTGGLPPFRLVSEMPRALINKFNVTSTPSVFLIDNQTYEFLMITDEFVALSELKERIIRLSFNKKWISKDEFNSTREAKREDFLKANNFQEKSVSPDEALDLFIEDVFGVSAKEQTNDN